MKIGFIGTGVMGFPMARHLAEAGHELTVYNRSAAKAERCADFARVAPTIREAVADAEVVFSIVGFVTDVEHVYLGQGGIVESVRPGTIICDMTTSSPDLAVRITKEAAKRGVIALDAPVTGGDRGAKEGTLSIMVGGEEAAYEKIKPLLGAMGKTLTYMGEAGCGQHAKLANQMAIAGAIGGLAEALSYAESHGLDGQRVLNVLNGGSASSWQSQNMGPKMLAGDFAPGFYIKHFIKDLRLGQLGRGTLDLPISATVLALYEKLLEEGHGDEGTQAILKRYHRD